MPHYFGTHWNWAPCWKYYFQLAGFFTCKSYEEIKSQINNACTQCEPGTMVIASLSNTNEQWVCVLQIGERGEFTDVQIGEHSKQRVKEASSILSNKKNIEKWKTNQKNAAGLHFIMIQTLKNLKYVQWIQTINLEKKEL